LGDLLRGQSPRGKLFERAEGNPVSLAQGSVDSPRFGHPHFGMVEDEWGDVAGMRIPVAHEASALGGFVDSGLENPEVLLWATQGKHRLYVDARAIVPYRQF